MCPKTGHTGGKCVFLFGFGGVRFRFFCQLLLQPILAVDVARDDEGDDVVARGVDHGRGGIDEIAERERDGEGDRQMVREEDGAQNQLARAAAARDAGHGRPRRTPPR